MYITLYKQTTNNTLPQNYNNIMLTPVQEISKTFYKTTLKIDNPTPFHKLPDKQHTHIINTVISIHNAYEILKDYKDNYEEQYYTFKIPKRSGGLRTINAPKEDFKCALTRVKEIFEKEIKCLPHDCAYAYVKERSVLDALKKHQNNKSNWYLKIDLTDFFPSCTPDFIYSQLTQLYPFYYIEHYSSEIKNELKEIIKICCLNGGLPQGTPMSPLLTNLIMVPYDYHLNQYLKRGSGEHFVYTRYADDILISSKNSFDWQYINTVVQGILRPFEIKAAKTRYGSKAGSNWNLGLMLNKDNSITLGHSKKKLLNAMLNNFLKDHTNNIRWSKEDTYSLQGQLSWLKHVEPGYYDYMIQKYEAKFNIPDYRDIIKNILL